MDKNSEAAKIVHHFVRVHYEKITSNPFIPTVLKHLIILFASTIFNSCILSWYQDFQFFKLISTLNIHIKPKLLYKASDHGFDKTEFHECCDDHGPTITLIQSQNHNIFGMYVDVKFPKYVKRHNNKFTKRRGKNICLFLIQSDDEEQKTPIMMRSISQNNYIGCNPDIGPAIGSGRNKQIMELCIDDEYHKCYTHRSSGFDYSEINPNNKNHRKHKAHSFILLEYEVFKLLND